MPNTITILSPLFTEHAIALAKKIPEHNIYSRLAWFYQEHLVPALEENVQNETDNWATIADAIKAQATQLINRLSQRKSPSELLQIIRFQRALLGKEPYQLKLAGSLIVSSNISAASINLTDRDINDFRFDENSFSTFKQPLIVFLKNIKKNQPNGLLGLSNFSASHNELTTVELRPYWLSYSILFEQLGQNDTKPLAQEEILEMLTAIMIEEPEKFQSKSLINSLDRLTTYDIIELFKHKKLSQQNFQIVFEAIFREDSENENGNYKRFQQLTKEQFIEILSCQPQCLPYGYQKNNSRLNDYLGMLTCEEIVNVFTQKAINRYKYQVYSYSEEEFYYALGLIIQRNHEFIKSLSNEAIVKLLCRLEFSDARYEKEKNQRSEAIFRAIKASGKIQNLEAKHWLDLFINANSAVIVNILSTSTTEKEKLIDIIKQLTSKQLQELLTEKKHIPYMPANHPKIFFPMISEKMLSIIYPYFNLDKLKDEQKAILIVTLAKNFTEKSFADCLQMMTKSNFNVKDIYFMVNNLLEYKTIDSSKYHDKSIHLIEVLFESLYEILSRDNLLELCQSYIEVAMALFTHKNNQVRNYVFNALTLTHFAEIAANSNYQHNVKKLLEDGLLEKIKLLGNDIDKSPSKEISDGLLTLLKSGPKNNDIFNFIYNNKTVRFIPNITHEHLVISLSHQLDSDDAKLKSDLIGFSFFIRNADASSLIVQLQNEDVLRIFLNARKNSYVLPSEILKTLMRKFLKHSKGFIIELNLFLQNQPISNHEEVKDIEYAFIFEAHKENSSIHVHPSNYLINYLQSDRFILINIISTQYHHEYLISFLNDKNIFSLLAPEDIVRLFLIEAQKKISFPLAVREKIVAQLLKHNENLSIQLQRDLTKQLADLFNNKLNKLPITRQHFEEAESKLLITIHQQVYEKNPTKHKQLLCYLDENKLALLVRHQTQYPQLIKLFQDHQLLEKLTPDIAKTLLSANPLLPTFISKVLVSHIFKQKNKSLAEIVSANLNEENEDNAKMHSALLLTLFLQCRSNITSDKFIQLNDYFSENSDEIPAILLNGVNQPDFNFGYINLLKLVEHPQIKKILTTRQNQTCLATAFLNLAKSQLNSENRSLIANTLLPLVSKRVSLRIFTELAVNGCTLDIEIQKSLVEKLNFKQLNRLIEDSINKERKNSLNRKTVQMVLDNICFSQIQRQKEFSIPAFVLSLLYGIFYYPTLGWLLHFLAPGTKPLYLYKALKKFFRPIEVARIKQKTYQEKAQLAKIAEDQLSIKTSSDQDLVIYESLNHSQTKNWSDEIILESVTDHEFESEFFDLETGEIKPFDSHKESYTYLFPGEKDRLNLKFSVIDTKIKTIQKEYGAVFWEKEDKSRYFVGEEKRQLILSEAEKQQLSQVIEESKKQSRQAYKTPISQI